VKVKNKKEVFKALREFLLDKSIPQQERLDVWWVLSALRGPDEIHKDDEKAATTQVIRDALFGPPEFGGTLLGTLDIGPDSEYKVQLRNKLLYDHFQQHAKHAFDALGLSWSDLNVVKHDEVK
jgi:hypothetical protein